MLLNLDLFTAQNDGPGEPTSAGDDSMLNQLRTLRSMGYLSADGPLPDVDGDSDSPPSAGAQASQRNQGGQQ
jgi:hypothetical protein